MTLAEPSTPRRGGTSTPDRTQSTSNNTRDAENYKLFWAIVLVITALVLLAWGAAIYWPTILHLPTDDALDARGNAIGALFSGLAFVGVVAAIFLQWRELGYQREELRQT